MPADFPPDLRRRRPRRAGFTFIEVMFAVVIMGFGVIMIAAMLPVALRQTQITRETAAGSASVESGFHTIETLWTGSFANFQQNAKVPAASVLRTTGGEVQTYPEKEMSLNNASLLTIEPLLLEAGVGGRIDTHGGTTAYVPFWSRNDGLAPHVTLLGIAARNVEGGVLPDYFFTVDDNCPLAAAATFTSGGVAVGGRVEAVGPDTVTFAARGASGSPSQAQVENALVEGAAVVTVNGRGEMRVLRLSKPTADPAVWELETGAGGLNTELNAAGTALVSEFGGTVKVYVVGRMLRDPRIPTGWDINDNPYVGSSQVTQVLADKVLP